MQIKDPQILGQVDQQLDFFCFHLDQSLLPARAQIVRPMSQRYLRIAFTQLQGAPTTDNKERRGRRATDSPISLRACARIRGGTGPTARKIKQ